jgi:hypothetical protein
LLFYTSNVIGFALGLILGCGRSKFDDGYVRVRGFAIRQFERVCHGAATGRRIKLEEDALDALRLEAADSGDGLGCLMNAGAAIEA